MCPQVCPDVGEVELANIWLNKLASGAMSLLLFQNNWTPAETDVIGNYTEANFPGYAAKALTGADFAVTGGAPTTAVAPAQTFTCSGATTQNIYGAVLKRTASGVIMTAERYAGVPFLIQNPGDNVGVTPTVTFD